MELEFSGVYIAFRGDHTRTEYCAVDLNKEKYELFAYAIKNHYWYQMYIDDLPIWGIVGEYDEKDDSYWLWTHKKFEIGYNLDRIVDVNLTSESKVKLQPGMSIKFSYDVTWKSSAIKFEDRFEKYLDPGFFQHRVRYYTFALSSKLNSNSNRILDPLVLDLQLVYDGHLPSWYCEHDSDANTSQGLRAI